MSEVETTNTANRVLEKYRAVTVSMVADQDKFDAPLVEMWWALAEANEEIEGLRTYIRGLQAKIRLDGV